MKVIPYIEALRLDRWPRSLSILVGSAAAMALRTSGPRWEEVPAMAIALAGTFAVALFNYSINEITDAPYDRHHPRKKTRPLAAERISARVLLGIGIALLAAGLLAGRMVSPAVLTWLSVFALAGVVYNVPPLRAKDLPFVDAAVESANNPIRFCIGWYALTPREAPPWSLALAWWAFGAFLMYAKRLSEKRYLTNEQAGRYRKSLEAYSQRALTMVIWLTAGLSLAGLGVFAHQGGHPRIFWVLPGFVAYYAWIFYETINRSGRVEEPEALFRRPVFVVLSLGLGALLWWSLGSHPWFR